MIKSKRILVLSVLLIGSCSYLPDPYENQPVELNETLDYIEVIPENPSASGLLFYPGGMVDPHGYQDLAVKLAISTDARVIIAKMPSNLAILKPKAAKKIIESFPEVENWILIGHSLGGVMATNYIKGNEEQIKGLVLLASYPDKSISSWEGVVLSLRGSEDGLVSSSDISSSSDYLPGFSEITDTIDIGVDPSSISFYHEISGANHAQFGSYGEQHKDGVALITVEQQHDSTAAYIRTLFRQKQW